VPRPPRFQPAGGYFHVTTRGNRREPIYLDDRDRGRFLSLFAETSSRFGWRCHGYCLIPNHYHLVVETPTKSLSAGMHLLNGTYARWFNWRHDYDGHVFARRFRSRVIESTWHLLEVFRYVALNPVRAGLCADPAQWRWGSYRAVLGLSSCPSFLAAGDVLGHFAPRRSEARRYFAEFVAEGLLLPRF
jgi:putative transposase